MLHQTSGRPLYGHLRSGAFQLGYSIEGNGRPLLIIGSHLYYRRTFSSALRNRLRLYFVDHRAFAVANSDVEINDFSFETVVKDIEEARLLFNLDRFAILGHSGHGYMAMEYARRYPERISHVVLAGTGPSQSKAMADAAEARWHAQASDYRKKIFEREIVKLSDDIEKGPRERFKHLLIRLGARSWYQPNFDARPLWKGVTINDIGFDHLWGEVFRDYRMTEVAADIKVPVLLALGRFDFLVAPPEAWEAYKSAFRNLAIAMFERSGHTMQFEESEVFDELLLDFLTD